MKERPILFSPPMVRAILEGRKSMTRRIVKEVEGESWKRAIYRMSAAAWRSGWWFITGKSSTGPVPCPYGIPGDRLWVREAHALKATENGWCVRYPADGDERLTDVDVDCHTDERWDDWVTRPSIHMYRWASRILLEITDVRVERLQEISEADAKAEGAPSADLFSGREVIFPQDGTHRWGFRLLWESINGSGSWEANPWVWVVCFKRVK